MLNINMEDVVGVLKTCKNQLIVLVVLLAVCVIAIIAAGVSRKMSKAGKKLVRGTSLVAMLLSIVLVANMICFGPMNNLITLATTPVAVVSDATNEEAKAIMERTAEEGFVLLENEDNVLPVKHTNKLNLFGWMSTNPLYAGGGSGGINNLFEKVSLIKGLENAGFEVNQELVKFYTDFNSKRAEMSIESQSWSLPEPTVEAYSQELIDNAKAFSDVAVVVIARASSEGHNDLPMDVSQVGYDNNSTEYEDFPAGEHYLQLSQTERRMIEMVCQNFDKVIVLYNGANAFEMGFVEEYPQIKGAIWCAGAGNVGFNALGRIIKGDVNPSGHVPDTFVYDMTKAPWWNNAAKVNYSNMLDMTVDGMNAGKPQKYSPSFVNYTDGIYVGYKFYETAHDVGMPGFDYEATVQYPFGFGLSYTTFDRAMTMTADDKQVTVEVTVTNTGDVAGKDVVGIYYNPPYTEGGIEKATVNLIDFGKTGLLEPGASEKLTMTFDIEDMASYDYITNKAYVLEAGDYVISARTDSHTVIASDVVNVPSTVVYSGDNKRESDDVAATNKFDDVHGEVTYLSRAGQFANFAEATAAPSTLEMPADQIAEYEQNSNFDYDKYINPDDVMPVTGAKNGLKLADLRGADYDDPRWEQLLDQMTVEEMLELTSMCGYQTPAVESVGKVQTNDADGPGSINNNFSGAGSLGFPSVSVIASTWSKELTYEYGRIMGKMARELDVAGWYAPGMNIHRYPFGGRNYEYYSEDGVLTGLLTGNAVAGAAENGVYAYIKHLALYDGNYKMVCIWSNEQAIREVYLKPFEICIKDFGANAVMASWNYLGTTWAGESGAMMNDVLRGEWGFRGMIISDYFRDNGHGFMNADAALPNGMDAMLSTYGSAWNVPHDAANPSASTVKYLRQASKNIMYVVVNSWEYESDVADGGMAGWAKLAIGADVIAAVVILGLEALVIKSYRKKKAAK